MYNNLDISEIQKPKCKGCIYQGTTLPCEYILITGRSPQSMGAHIDPEGPGGCELYTRGEHISQTKSITYSKKRPKFNNQGETTPSCDAKRDGGTENEQAAM